MANVTTKQYKRLKVQPKISSKSYREAWLNFGRLGRKMNRLWKTKKTSLELLREERE